MIVGIINSLQKRWFDKFGDGWLVRRSMDDGGYDAIDFLIQKRSDFLEFEAITDPRPRLLSPA
jgi:hypothetical protein